MFFQKKYTDPTDEIQMLDKAFEFVQKQYDNKSITLEEFSKKCEEIRKKREKIMKKVEKKNN